MTDPYGEAMTCTQQRSTTLWTPPNDLALSMETPDLPPIEALDRLAERVADHGIAAHEDDLDPLLAAATQRCVDEVIVGVVADSSLAPVLRERALGRLLVALARTGERSRTPDGRAGSRVRH